MVEDVVGQIERSGGTCAVSSTEPGSAPGVVIRVQESTGRAEAYTMCAVDLGTPVIEVSAAGAEGLKWALVDLILAMDSSPDGMSVPSDLSIVSSPKYVRRGMYAHLHWSYNHPYALRTWSIDEWKRYIDLLTYMKVNHFQFWTMAAILPVPLSEGDRAYLSKYYEIVDYARNERGMTVVPGECANNIAKGDLGVPFEKRDYFEAEIVMDPNDPEQMAKVRESRKQMYETIPNGDGYWIIDSDPGGWKDSPAGQFVDILQMNKEILAEVGNPNAIIYYWMAFGWGVGCTIEDWIASLEIKEKTWESVVACMKERFPEPWGILAMSDDHLNAAANQGELSRTIAFPYGFVEHEPAPPHTHVRFATIKERIDSLRECYPELYQIMANAQTPFVQLPNIYAFHRLAWGADDLNRETALLGLATELFPDRAQVLADAWSTIRQDIASDDVTAAADALERSLADGFGRYGVLTQYLPERGERIVLDLLTQLRAHAAVLRAAELARGSAEPEEIVSALGQYLIAALKWQDRHAYHGATDRIRPLLALDDWPLKDEAVACIAKDDESRLALASRLAHLAGSPEDTMTDRLSKEITGSTKW